MHPDQLPGAIRQKASLLGLHQATVLLVDKRQLVLSPFLEGDGAAVDINTSDAGRCFRTSTVVAVAEGVSRTRLWFPVVNGTARIGVMEAVTEADGELVRLRGIQLAALAAELLEAKSKYGDHIVNASRREELSLAAEVRWALVPPLTFMSPEISIAGYLEPAYDLAGDMFDYAVNGNTAHVAIMDAVGHGMEASRIANLAVLSYRHSRRRGLGLVETYAAMDAAIEQAFDRSAYATAQLATLDLPDGILRWINAGHPPPLLVRAGRLTQELVGQADLPVGISDDRTPDVHQFPLEPGDVVAFYSDGITEARSSDGTMFGADRLAAMIERAMVERLSPPEIVRQISHSVVEHQGGDPPDDATLLFVGWRLARGHVTDVVPPP